MAAAGRFLRPSGWLPRPRLSGGVEPDRMGGETQTPSPTQVFFSRTSAAGRRRSPVRSRPARRFVRRARCFSKPTHPSVAPSGSHVKSVGPRGVAVPPQEPSSAVLHAEPYESPSRRGSPGLWGAAGGYLVDPASSICLSQRLSHASLSTHGRYSETANGSLNQLWFL